MLPHWDMSEVFPSLDSAEFEGAAADLRASIAALRDDFDASAVRTGTAVDAAAYDRITTALNAVRDAMRTIYAYVSAFVSVDARDDAAQARLSDLQTDSVEISKLATRYLAWLGGADADSLCAASPTAKAHAFHVRRARVAAEHQMTEAEEDLAASLQPSGESAWTRLRDNVTARIEVEVDGRTIPMTACRALAHDPSDAVRDAAFRAEIRGFEAAAVPIAAALNGVKGQACVLNGRRGWRDALEPMLFLNNVDRETLEAMQEACIEAFPDFRRYLRAKAGLLGKPVMAFSDLFGPVGSSGEARWSFEDATAFIVEQFGTYSDELAGLADRAFRERWVDAEPRLGKRDGAFCMSVRDDESRVLCNFEPSFDSVSTLAHELGHAYHNTQLATRTALQRETPMALAETASIFCQTIVTNSMLGRTSGAEKLSILENDLQDACQVVVDIHSRFLFERAVFDRRLARELSVKEFCDLMLEAQHATYGDGLAEMHPYMWAAKPHYYGRSFYNWPYTFGLLFGLGLYAQYRSAPDAFRAGYDDLLSSTGLDDAAKLAARFGFDVRTTAFWRASLDQVRARVDEFEALASAD